MYPDSRPPRPLAEAEPTTPALGRPQPHSSPLRRGHRPRLRAGRRQGYVLGLLHDIGRFEQARRFHTFIDYKSMDHARYGVWYLFEQGHIRDSCRIRNQSGTGSWNWPSCGTMPMPSRPGSPEKPGILPFCSGMRTNRPVPGLCWVSGSSGTGVAGIPGRPGTAHCPAGCPG